MDYKVLDNEITRVTSPAIGYGIDGRQSRRGIRARLLTGISDESLCCATYTDMGTTSEYSFIGIAAGTSSPNIGGPGVLRINGGAAGQGGTINFPGFGTIFGSANMAQKRWYLFANWRIAINPPNGDTRFYLLFSNGSMAGSAAIGINGRVQTAKYAFSCPNADALTTSPALNVLSAVSPVVGPWTTGELWYDGDAVYGAINEENPVRVAEARTVPNSASTSPQFESRPAASTQTDAIDLDAMGMWMEQ